MSQRVSNNQTKVTPETKDNTGKEIYGVLKESMDTMNEEKELTFEENIISNKEEDIQLSKIIINMKNIFKEKVSTISLIELFKRSLIL